MVNFIYDDPYCLMKRFNIAVMTLTAGIAGLGISAGFVAFMERAAVRSATKIDEKVLFMIYLDNEILRYLTFLRQLMTKLASKVDGGDAENKFSGSDQSLDALIAAMEEAQAFQTHASCSPRPFARSRPRSLFVYNPLTPCRTLKSVSPFKSLNCHASY